jgi:hypothetical protein
MIHSKSISLLRFVTTFIRIAPSIKFPPISPKSPVPARNLSRLKLLSQDTLQSIGISSELANTLSQLLYCHGVLVEIESESGLIVDVGLLLDIQRLCLLCVELLRDSFGGSLQFLEKIRLFYISLMFMLNGRATTTYRYRQVITTSQFCNLTNASERSTHNDSWVIVLLVVVENSLDGCDTGVFLGRIGLSSLRPVPIHDTSNKRRNKESASLSSGNSLDFGKQQGKIAIDLVVTLEDAGGLNTFPCGSNLDQNTGLVNADSFVKLFLS